MIDSGNYTGCPRFAVCPFNNRFVELAVNALAVNLKLVKTINFIFRYVI